MPYASATDLKAVIPPRDLELLTDWDGAIDTVDDTRLEAALDDAAAEIDGWIMKRVTLPLATPPRILMTINRDLAVYRLHLNAGQGVPEAVEKLREGALAYLKGVANGTISLGDETPGDGVEASPGAVLEEGAPPVFTRDSLKGF